MTTPRLTYKQLAVLSFLREFQLQRGSMPTHADIARHYGWKSPNTATDYIKVLEREGCIEHLPGIARGLRITAAGLARLGTVAPGREEAPKLIRLPVIDPCKVKAFAEFARAIGGSHA